jgi:hypothetical protein
VVLEAWIEPAWTFLDPRDFKLNPDTETIESYLHESEEYQ